MLHFEPLWPVPLVWAKPHPTTAMFVKSFWPLALKSERSRRKVLFSDISNFRHFYKHKHPWSCHSDILTHDMISGSTDSPLQSTFTKHFYRQCPESENPILLLSTVKWHCTKIVNNVSRGQLFCCNWQTLHFH